ncbi:ribosomal protein S9, Ribosomal protein S5 domain 2-type fold protein [Artemisia annua]|uniref:Ribosomal protein S9, Ribosomal protein S5 domain 2-type fold protein n=1 Tax=Artemisia annua TaxID=35608 RepID=A0A2U1N1E8_ARTAN|nr:ribosomal protein S9, Ribosomal protein S5 domain 2-type fold protein [Artemisia annua]
MLDSLMALKDLDDVPGLPPLSTIEDMRYEKNTCKSTRADIERQKQEEIANARVRQIDSQGRAYGTGKSKCSIARVWIEPGEGHWKTSPRSVLSSLERRFYHHHTIIKSSRPCPHHTLTSSSLASLPSSTIMVVGFLMNRGLQGWFFFSISYEQTVVHSFFVTNLQPCFLLLLSFYSLRESAYFPCFNHRSLVVLSSSYYYQIITTLSPSYSYIFIFGFIAFVNHHGCRVPHEPGSPSWFLDKRLENCGAEETCGFPDKRLKNCGAEETWYGESKKELPMGQALDGF